MTAKTKRKRPTKPFVMSESEKHLRYTLSNSGGKQGKRIAVMSDDRGLHDWIKAMNTPTNDARSGWEKRIQERLATELGIS